VVHDKTLQITQVRGCTFGRDVEPEDLELSEMWIWWALVPAPTMARDSKQAYRCQPTVVAQGSAIETTRSTTGSFTSA
jgi:hypothetical protein